MNKTLVRWKDSCSTDEWHEIRDDYSPSEIETIGYLVHEDADCIAVAGSVTRDEERGTDACCVMVIPKVVIAHREEI